MFYLFRKKGTTWGTTKFLDFAISELQNGALLRSLTKFFLVRALLFGIASLAKMRSLALLRSPDGTLKMWILRCKSAILIEIYRSFGWCFG
jgi:hypothetical protein